MSPEITLPIAIRLNARGRPVSAETDRTVPGMPRRGRPPLLSGLGLNIPGAIR
ncbi:hypothetical protein GCM10008965_30770 [Methylorubrum aminovorans]|nr:hypothetical protein GCM10025880_50910 [Methylorubrum aminovorans]